MYASQGISEVKFSRLNVGTIIICFVLFCFGYIKNSLVIRETWTIPMIAMKLMVAGIVIHQGNWGYW